MTDRRSLRPTDPRWVFTRRSLSSKLTLLVKGKLPRAGR